jgi:predicted acylesterase/phospholipase RssA/CRP-like cAMP-binding protein
MINPPDTPALALIASVEFFQPLSPEEQASVAHAMERLTLAPGETLVRQGELGDAMYVVESGVLRALVRRKNDEVVEVGRINPGHPVGEMQFVGGGTRGATVEAVTPCVVHRLRRTIFDTLPPAVERALASSKVVHRRLHSSQLAFVLPSIFGPLEPQVLAQIEKQIEWVNLPRGQALFHQGDVGDGWYLVLSGRLRIVVTDTATREERAVAELGRGDSLGEVALITGDRRNATPYAIRDSLLARFSKQSFEEIMTLHPRALLSICRTLVKQTQNSKRRSGALSRLVITVTPAGNGSLAPEFARALTRALGVIGSALHVDAHKLSAEGVLNAAAGVPADHPSWLRFTAWLEEHQTHYEFVVLETDRHATGWTHRALGQADHVVVVGHAATDRSLGEIEEQLLLDKISDVRRARRTLVMVHPETTLLPSGTHEWLAMRRVDLHLHVHANRQEDVERVARTITGRAVGVALGGGGARGFAHFGVIKALRELGIPIDALGGTSMGSIMAAQLATGRTLEQLYELNRQIIALKPFQEYTVPMIAMLKTKRITESALMSFGDTRIEDLWLPYFAVSSNLTTAEMVVHETGPLWEATRASGSLPGIAVPVVSGQHLLVDGGVVNNLPGDVMRNKCGGGPVIAVNVSPEEEVGIGAGGFPSPWKILWSRVLPFRKKITVPGMLDILMRTTMLASASRTTQVKNSVDLYLRPPVDDFGMLEFERMPDLVEVGYRYTLKAAAGWKPPTT